MQTIFPTSNLLISSMQESDAASLKPFLVRVALGHREVLAEADVPMEYVYFLEDGVASVVNTFEDGSESESGVFGLEGTSVVLGVNQAPTRIYMQVDGTHALRIKVGDMLNAIRDIPAFSVILQHYTQVSAIQAGNTAAVNARFEIRRRLARWLLMCHDRVSGDRLNLTHESLSIMLGVRRSGVTVAMQAIEKMGLIQTERGLLDIVNRAGLERLAGSAYGTTEKEYCRLLGPFGKSKNFY